MTTLGDIQDRLGVRAPIAKTSFLGDSISLWTFGGLPSAGATPPSGAGEVPTGATTGALALPAAISKLRLASAAFQDILAPANASLRALMLYDRLVHTSGLVGNVTGVQTINSVSVTRPDASGAGVLLNLEGFGSSTSTGGTATLTYTNQDGASKTTPTFSIANIGSSEQRQIPLAAGDTGVRSVQSMNVLTASSSAGAFGVVLTRPLAIVTTPDKELRLADFIDLGLSSIDANACVAFTSWAGSTGSKLVGDFGLVDL